MASKPLLSLAFMSVVYFVSWLNCIQGGWTQSGIAVPEGVTAILNDIDEKCVCDLAAKLVTYDTENVFEHIAKIESSVKESGNCNKTKPENESFCKDIPTSVINCYFSYNQETETYTLKYCSESEKKSFQNKDISP